MEEFELKLSGFHEVGEIDKNVIRNSCGKFYKKNNRKLKNIEFIEIRLKDFQKSGTRKKFSVNSTLGFSGTVLTSKGLEWDLIKAIDLSLKRIEKEIQRKFVGKIGRKSRKKARAVNRRFA